MPVPLPAVGTVDKSFTFRLFEICVACLSTSIAEVKRRYAQSRLHDSKELFVREYVVGCLDIRSVPLKVEGELKPCWAVPDFSPAFAHVIVCDIDFPC